MQKYDKKLSEKILPRFNNAKDWSDLMTIIKNLKENVKKYNDCNMFLISDKVLLSKRLAQSLNPSLPDGLHEITLEVYDMLFENIRANQNNYLGTDLGLYSSGLFPFFQFASVPNKNLYLNNIVIKHYLGLNDIELALCLPGFLVSILPGLEDQNESLLKLLNDILNKVKIKVGDSKFYGTLWTEILRTPRIRLCAIKYLFNAVPQYKVLEKSLDTKDQFISNYYPNLNVLVLNSMIALIEDENIQVQRFALDFIITHFPINNVIIEEEQKITLIISALSLLIKNEYSTKRRLVTWLMGSNQDDELEMGDPLIKYMIELLILSIKRIFDITNSTKERLNNGIKIIDQLFKEQVKLVDYILEFVSIDLILCLEKYWSSVSNNTVNDEVLIKVKKFFDYDSNYQDCLWNSLGKLLNKCVNEENEDYQINMNNSIKLLKLCLTHIRLDSVDKKNKFYIPIISSLLRASHNVKLENTDLLIDLKYIVVLALKFTKDLQGDEIHKNDYSDNIDITYTFKHTIKNILSNEQNYYILESFKENILLFQSLYIEICKLLLLNHQSISHHEMKVFKITTELLLRTQEYSYQEIIPNWILYLIKVIFCENIKFSLEAIDYLLDLIMINSENDVYTIIKYYLRNEDLTEKAGRNYIYESNIQRNCCELSMGKLWSLLEEQSCHKKIIDLLIKFYKAEPIIFSNTISNSFAMNDLDQNVNAIRKFTQFWKLTSEYYPEIIFFDNGECIFKMLDFLDHDHPLLRHLSKSWLSQSVAQFNKILDPLLKVLLDKETSWYISPKKQLYLAKEYDNRRIIEAFRKLKNIIINMPDLAISYFVNQPVKENLLDLDQTGKEISSYTRSIPIEHYLELLVSISLRFIQGKFIESVSQTFYRENFSVNAASCEFLEFLLSFIEPKSKVMNIAEMIAEPVLMILHENIMSNDEVMQVQLLNLLKVLLFNTQMVHKDFIQQAINIFNSQILHDCLNMGIQINYIFVRSHFISFLECCLPIFRDILDQDSNLRIASKLLITTSDFLVRRVKYYTGSITRSSILIDEKMNNLRKLSHIDFNDSSKFFIIKNYIEEYKEFKSFDENDVHVIIKGLKQILFHFINIENPIINIEKINWVDLKKMLGGKTNSGTLGDYLSGLFSSKNFDEGTKKTTSTISLEIYGILEDILASFLCCWVNESENCMTKDLCLNVNGILEYNLDNIKFQGMMEESGFNKQNQNKILKSTKILKMQIININQNLFISNLFEYMNKFISLWLNEGNRYISKDKQYKLSMIELLVSLNLPMEIILSTIIKNINLSKIKDIKKSKIKVRDFYPYILNRENCVYEAKICQLVYSYIAFTNNLLGKNTIEIWNEIINLLNIFLESKSHSTLFWIYEILNLMLHRLSIRDTQDKTLRNKLVTLVTTLFNRTMEFSINNKIDVIFDESSQIVTPMNPSFYEKVTLEVFDKELFKINTALHERINYNTQHKGSLLIIKEDLSDESIRSFYLTVYDHITNSTVLKNEDLLIIYRNIGFITLKSLFYQTMRNIYLTEKNDKLISHIQVVVKNLIVIMGERITVNKIYTDLATEFIHNLMMNAPALVSNSCKNQIMDFFLEPEFFNMSKKCLRLWKEIIREFAHYYQDIIVDLLNTLYSSSFFSKGSDKFKIKALRRVSFIIYACNKDTYSNKLGLILEKVKEVITTYGENPPLESEIFLMIRIMFLRFSHENLVEMLRHLWPIIFSELVTIINKKKKTNSLDLTLSSLKLIELLSLANMEEFCLYQWIFIPDTYDINKMNPENELNILTSIHNSDSKCFKPFEMDFIKDLNDFFKNPDLIIDLTTKRFDEYEKRGLILQMQKFNDNNEISIHTSRLLFYIALMNNFKHKVDWDTVENVIENDFLTAH